MIQLETASIEVGGKSLVISENDWDMSRKLSRLTEEEEKSVNGGTSALDFFRKNFYPILAAPASGEVPDAFQAFSLSRQELDLWYCTVWKLNSDWFTIAYTEDPLRTMDVVFRDGSTVTVQESRGLPSYMLRLAELENDAIVNPSEDADMQLFRLVFYPKMAACVVKGDIPPAEVLRKYPTREINKLYEAAAQLNPDWFDELSGLSEEARAALKEKERAEKKKEEMTQAG